jgi:hypothetical protein
MDPRFHRHRWCRITVKADFQAACFWKAARLKVLLLAPMVVFLPGPASGQSVGGRVVDFEGQTIEGAVVSFIGESGGTLARIVTNAGGRFGLVELSPGNFRVTADRLGFRTTQATLALRRGDTVQIELTMATEPIPMEPLVVTASRRPPWEHTEPPGLWEFWERKERYEELGIGSHITETELKPFAGQKVTYTVADLHPFLQALPHAYRPSTILLRGRSGCKPLVYVDGNLVSPRFPLEGYDPGPTRVRGFRSQTLMPDSIGRGEESLDEFISLSEIAAIEVYRGASDIPGEFHSGIHSSSCGAVVVWSKRR